MDGRRGTLQQPHLTGFVNISEPELDMPRGGLPPAGALARLRETVRKLISHGRGMVSPMRSIARELEESWPGGEP